MGAFTSKLGKPLVIFQTLSKYPFGNVIFGWLFCLAAPYFWSIRPHVNEMKPGFASVSMKQRWAVQNHIGTIHAISVCNLVEMALGLVAESTIPDHLRWLPMGMNVDYLKKATGQLTATSTIDPDSFFTLPKYPGEVKVPVEVRNAEGVLVTKAEVRVWVSFKPEKGKKAQ